MSKLASKMLSSSCLPLAVVVLIAGVAVAQDCSQWPRMHPGQCCKIPKLLGEGAMHSCMQNNRVKRGLGGRGGPNSCTIECAFKAAGILQNDAISFDTLRTTLTNNANGNQEVINAINAGLTKCVNPDGTATAAATLSNAGSAQCNINPSAVFMCIYKEIMLNCPASLATTSDECTTFKNYVQNCPPPAFT